MYHAPRGKGFFLPWLIFHFWVEKRGFFGLFSKSKTEFSSSAQCSSPRRILTLKIAAMPRHREGLPRHRGLPRRGKLRLGEPGDNEGGHSGLPR